jgi:hypothetical protein
LGLALELDEITVEIPLSKAILRNCHYTCTTSVPAQLMGRRRTGNYAVVDKKSQLHGRSWIICGLVAQSVVIVDCDDLQGGLDVLERLRKGASNKNSVSFAILNGHTKTHRAFELGANFVLQKPISALNAMRGFNAGLWLMTIERRRYFRHPVEMAVTVIFGQGQKLTATATNISQSGMAIRFRSGELQKGSISKVIFTLPGTHVLIETKTDLAWADGTGRAGLALSKCLNARLNNCSTGRFNRWKK